jgi:hypothetical protein
LVKKTERKNKIFGGAWEQAMRVAYMVSKGGEVPPDMFRLETVWRDPSTPTYAAKADAAVKLYANGMGVIPRERARIDMGYTITERQEMEAWDTAENPMGVLAGMYGGAPAPGGKAATGPETPTQTPAPPASEV